MDQWTLAVSLAALAEYSLNHPEQVAAVDQAEAALLAQWGRGVATVDGGDD